MRRIEEEVLAIARIKGRRSLGQWLEFEKEVEDAASSRNLEREEEMKFHLRQAPPSLFTYKHCNEP